MREQLGEQGSRKQGPWTQLRPVTWSSQGGGEWRPSVGGGGGGQLWVLLMTPKGLCDSWGWWEAPRFQGGPDKK